MTDVTTDFEKLSRSIRNYMDDYRKWQSNDLTKPCKTAMQDLVTLDLAFQHTLEGLNLFTPQMQYARCLLEKETAQNIKIAKTNAKAYKKNEATLQQYFDINFIKPDMFSRILEGDARGILAATLYMPAEVAQIRLNTECNTTPANANIQPHPADNLAAPSFAAIPRRTMTSAQR